MANDLNVTTSNLVRNLNKLFYNDATLFLKIKGDTSFTALGVLKGEKKFTIAKEYLDLEEGIPKQVIAKVVKKQTITLSGKLAQIQPDALAAITGNYLDSTTTAGHKRVILASETYAPLEGSVILQTKTRDLKTIEVGLRNGILSQDSLELLFGADDWGTIDFTFTFTTDSEPLDTNFTWPCKNSVSSADDECTISNASKDISLASTTGFLAGMYVYTAANGNIGTIDSVTTDTKITLLANPASSESGVTIKAILPSLIDKDDIGYIDFED